ncbi:MAG TPA: hypothetical protein PK228_19270, partial [Saprospiraceae bacterium]|nr:hypothetical protein [Saprospiraceae bacterium]
AMLESQMEQTTVSGTQMRQWLKEEIEKLDEQSAVELGLPSDSILRQGVKDGHIKIDPNNQITGLMVQEWGLTQPLTTNGKATIEKKHWHHLRAYRYNEGRPLVGVYYLHFIYMTPDTIGFCGFFYDFILAKRFGTYTQQLFYRDIVNIGAREEDTKILSDQEEWQTKQIIMSFTNGERISIALTDTVAIENLREQIEKGSDTDKLSELTVEALPGTRANFILTSVKTYWNEKKGMKLPPREDLLP